MDMDKTKRTELRRKDRAVLDDSWIAAFLRRAPFMTVAFSDDNSPYVYPITFVYSEPDRAIYFHGTPHGTLRRLAERNTEVALTVAEMGRLLPSPIAMGFSVEFSSVVVYGTCTIITSFDEGSRALELMIAKYFPHLTPSEHYRPTTPAEFKATSVYKVAIEDWVGKRKRESDDFPGAITYPYNDNETS